MTDQAVSVGEASDPWAMTNTGKLMRDAWVFGLLPEGQGLAGQNAVPLQMLADDAGMLEAAWKLRELHAAGIAQSLYPDTCRSHPPGQGERLEAGDICWFACLRQLG